MPTGLFRVSLIGIRKGHDHYDNWSFFISTDLTSLESKGRVVRDPEYFVTRADIPCLFDRHSRFRMKACDQSRKAEEYCYLHIPKAIMNVADNKYCKDGALTKSAEVLYRQRLRLTVDRVGFGCVFIAMG